VFDHIAELFEHGQVLIGGSEVGDVGKDAVHLVRPDGRELALQDSLMQKSMKYFATSTMQEPCPSMCCRTHDGAGL
jgi:hypothetical protein